MYNIRKCYEGKPSQIEKKGLTLQEATTELDINEMLWVRHGGFVFSRTEFELICEESDGSEVIRWLIDEVDE